MRPMNNVAIIGGGAAGLMAAITASKSGAAVDLYEHNSGVGKKVLASGNGRCNIINTTSDVSDYFGHHSDFAAFALSHFPFSRFQKFCRGIGLLLDVKEDGRCYPLSNEAKSVVLALETSALESGAKLLTGETVTAIAKTSEGFVISFADSPEKTYDKVLICTGSEAAPQLGGCGDGYAFAKAFGHSVEPTYPSLVQLHIDSPFHHKMAGVKQLSKVTLYIDGKAEEQVKGDILFTRYGISGFAVLDISQKASAALMAHQEVSIGLNLLPDFERQSLASVIAQLCQAVPTHTIATVMSGVISSKIVPHLLQTCNIRAETKAGEITTKTSKSIVHALQQWRFRISGTHGFKHAEVSGGGVSTEEIDPKTMASTRIDGLYFAGEVIDIVGRRGGYNFHFAWASGYIAGKSLAASPT
jgi:predicted Rossmann fold flavoprotein